MLITCYKNQAQSNISIKRRTQGIEMKKRTFLLLKCTYQIVSDIPSYSVKISLPKVTMINPQLIGT